MPRVKAQGVQRTDYRKRPQIRALPSQSSPVALQAQFINQAFAASSLTLNAQEKGRYAHTLTYPQDVSLPEVPLKQLEPVALAYCKQQFTASNGIYMPSVVAITLLPESLSMRIYTQREVTEFIDEALKRAMLGVLYALRTQVKNA